MGKRKMLAAPARRKPPQTRVRGGADARFQSLIRLSRGVYWESDSAHRFTRVVHGPMFVSTQAPDSQIGKTRWEIPSTRPDAAGWEAHKAALDAHLAFRDFEFARVGPDGAERQFVVSGEPLFDATGRFTGYCGVGEDVTERKRAEEALRESEARFRSLTEMSSDWYWEQDRELRLSFHSSSFARRSGTTSDKLLGKCRWEEPNRFPLSGTWDEHRATLEAHEPFRNFEYVRIGDDGEQYFVSLSGVPIFDAAGHFNGYRGVGTNITDLVKARERTSQLAYTDPLTGLANRTSFGPALEHAAQLARRHDRKLAIMFLDLDGFKAINDAHGHDAGDQILIEVAGRLRACLRSSDLVARLGGDEFVVVLEDMQDADQVEAVACKLVAEIARPHSLVAGEESCVSASIGISMLPDDAGDPRTLMKHADTAMYCAKQSGKNGYRFFTGESADSTTQAQDAGA